MTSIGKFFLAALVLLPIGLGACGDSVESEPASHKLEEFEDGLAGLEGVVTGHGTTIANAADLTAVTGEELAYESNVSPAHDELHHMLEEVGMCMDGDAPLDVSALEVEVEEFEDELAAHALAMAGAADLGAAQTEETRHQLAMQDIATLVRGEATTVEGAAVNHLCEHHEE